jgi:hypothetical protein
MDITLTEAVTFILDHNQRVKDMPNPKPEAEYVAVKIEGLQVEKLSSQGAVDFIVFHGVENDNNTVILMGLKADGTFVRNTAGDIKALERWDKFGPTVQQVDDDINQLLDIFK